MCTSTASKPARSNATAISTWPLTPCSRRIATRGRAPVAMYGAATSSAGSNVELRAAGRARRSGARHRAPRRRIGVVAQALHRVRDRPPGIEQLLPAPFGQRLAAERARGSPAPCVGRAMRCAQSIRPWRATRSANAARSSRATCTTAPSSSLNSVRQRDASPQPSSAMSRPQCEANAISHKRGERAAVGAVVIGQQQAGLARVADQFEERAQALRIVEIGHAARRPRAQLTHGSGWHCARIEPPRRCWPAPRPISQSSVSRIAHEQRRELRAHVGDRRERGDDQRHRRHRISAAPPSAATAPASTANPCRPGC